MDTQVIESPAAPSTPAPAAAEPSVKAPDAPAAANPTRQQPVRQGVKPAFSDEAIAAEKAAERQRIREVLKQAAKTNGTQTPGEPAAPKPTDTASAAAANEEGAGVQNSKEAASPDKTEPETSKGLKESIVVKGTDKEGKPVDVTVTRQQAINALLRNRIPADAIEGWSNKRILEIGAQQFLLQQENDRRWNQVNEERRRAGGEKAPEPKAPESSTLPQAARTEGQAPTPPAAAQPASSAVQATATDLAELEADVKAFEEAAGPDAAAPLRSVLSKLRGTLEQATGSFNKSLETERQNNANLVNLMLEDRFGHGFETLESDFPQIAGDGEKAQEYRQNIRQTADALAASGRFKNPWDRATFKTILREAADACLGHLKAETHARQLAARQKQQAAGQIPAQQTREDAPAAALSDKEVKRRAMQEYIRTGDLNKGRQKMRELSTSSG